MTIKAEGVWSCTVLSGTSGKNDRGVITVQITAQIDDGPSKGQRCTYEDVVDTQSAKFVNWSLTACGYKGGGLRNVGDDIAAWIAATGGKTTVEIKHLELKRGKAYDKWVDGGCNGSPPIWDKVQGIGRGAARPLKPLAKDQDLADADAAMREVAGAPSDSGGTPGDFEGYGAPDSGMVDPGSHGDRDDIPFATSAMSAEPCAIARVLR